MRPSARHRGYGGAWPLVRLAFLRKHPICAFCLERGHTTTAAEVDHIVPLAAGGTHDGANLRALCKPCHSSRTARDQGFARSRR
jgi:5-methylcytosine-specific restriction protein A